MRIAAALVLLLATPGLVLPGGVELRACFCHGLLGSCCHEPQAPEAPAKSCCSHARVPRSSAPMAIPRARPCTGCVVFSLPHSKPVDVAAHLAFAAPAIEPSAVDSGLAAAEDTPEHRFWLDPWHAPPLQRQLPLLI